MLKLLVVAAWEPELTRLRQRSADVRHGASRPVFELVLDTIGVGVVEAAVGMTQCIVRHAPAAALLIGTCGAFRTAGASGRSGGPGIDSGASRIDLGAAVAGARVCIVDAAVIAGGAALPEPMPAVAPFDAAIHAALVAAGARSVQIANTVGITTADAHAAQLVEAGCGEVEHLEAFGFARACAAAGVPCGAVLGVANTVGASGRAEWLAGHVSASAVAADLAWDALGAIAAGMLASAPRTSTTAR